MFSLFIAGSYLEIGFCMAFISIYMYGVHFAIYPIDSAHLHERLSLFMFFPVHSLNHRHYEQLA